MNAATLLTIATLLPLASFVLLVFLGKRLGNPLAGWVGTAFIVGSFACSMLALLVWLPTSGVPDAQVIRTGEETVRAPIQLRIPWIPTGAGIGQARAGYLDLGIYVDSLTIAMFAMITLVAAAVHVFSLGYMAGDKRFPRFFTYLSLFCFSMLGLVIGGTLLHLFVFWELVGLCSYLLIGFWYEKKSASNAAIKAFVTNRIGDFGFLIGLGILFYHLGNVTLPDVWRLLDVSKMGADGAITLPNGVVFGGTLLTVMGIGLFFGAVGKSAQFPLHVWLPDAMEGPTPVSALIHAATMVAAGVYLVGRIFPILTPDARLFIAIIGVTTLTMAALIALVQSDIKKVLAYSTLSQLGYMILAMGIGSWVGGLFHLITHAFFKALLFLGSGSVIYAAHHEQELPQYGGLWRKIPWTALTFGIAVLAIAGTGIAGVGFAGFYSKDMIVRDAGAFSTWMTSDPKRSGWFWAFFLLPTAIAYVTAFYMTRCWMLTFWGKPRNKHVYDHAQERPVMFVPLIALAVLSIVGGFPGLLGAREMIANSTKEATALIRRTEPTFNGFAAMWNPDGSHSEAGAGKGGAAHAIHTRAQAQEHGEHLMHTWVGWAFLVGIGLGAAMYWRGYGIANALMKVPPLRWLHAWLYRRMYFDELYRFVFIGVTMFFAYLAAWFDRFVVDGVVNGAATLTRMTADLVGLNDRVVVDGSVTGVANAARGMGAMVRNPTSGRIRLYVTLLVGAVSLGVVSAIIITLSR